MINIGAVIGVLPVTGIPLPFISFGGSSLIITMAAVGILHQHRRPRALGAAPTGLGGDRPPGERRAVRTGGRGRHRRASPAGAGHRRGPGRRRARARHHRVRGVDGGARTGPPWRAGGSRSPCCPGGASSAASGPPTWQQHRRRGRAGRGRGARPSAWWSGPAPGWWSRSAATPAFRRSLAAVVSGVPLVLVNVDAVPGAANRLFGRFARASAVGWAGNPLPRCGGDRHPGPARDRRGAAGGPRPAAGPDGPWACPRTG